MHLYTTFFIVGVTILVSKSQALHFPLSLYASEACATAARCILPFSYSCQVPQKCVKSLCCIINLSIFMMALLLAHSFRQGCYLNHQNSYNSYHVYTILEQTLHI